MDRGRTEEAKQLIFKVAAINKRTFPESLLEKVRTLYKKTFLPLFLDLNGILCPTSCALQIVGKETEKKGGIKVLIQSSVLRKYFFTIILGW